MIDKQFLAEFKRATEARWATQTIDPSIFGFQFQRGTRWLPGLSDEQIAAFEAVLSTQFPDDLRAFLGEMNGTDLATVNIYGSGGQPPQQSVGVYSYPRDLEVVRDRISTVREQLTQRRRREGRGNTFAPVPIKHTPRPRICEICGTEGVKNRYCGSCGVEISRENMARVALIGHARPKTARRRKQISKKLSDHAVANTWWSPSSRPAWLNEEFYVHKIQPQLRTLKVREIAQAMQVSQAYAAFIRSGRRRPHPRHWIILAKLTGIQEMLKVKAGPAYQLGETVSSNSVKL